MAPKSEYNDKIPNPFSVRLSDEALGALRQLRRGTGLSEGDMVEWLLRETAKLKLVKRNRPGNLTERISFRVSEHGNALLRELMDTQRCSGGDVVEAYIMRAANKAA